MPGTLGDLILGCLLLGVGIGVSVYLLVLVASACSQSFGGFFERAAFRRSSTRCAQGDQLLEKGDLAGAVDIFSRAFFLRPIRRDSALLSEIADYHTRLLSRLLVVADEMGKGHARLPSLAETDRLLTERLETHLEYFSALRKGEDEQAQQLARRLREHETRVRAGLERLISEIRSSEERVLYH